MIFGLGYGNDQGTLRRRLARAFVVLAALVAWLGAPGSVLAAARAIGFSNLVVRIDDDDIGLASGDYRVLILEELRKVGLNAVGAENLVFNQDASESAELVLGGTLRELKCIEVKRRGNCSVAVAWEVLDVQQQAVVYRGLTRHAEFGYDGKNSKQFGRQLVLGALRSLLGRKTFRDVVAQPMSVESTSYPVTAFAACKAGALQMPGSFEDAARATVLISTGNGFGSGFFLGSEGLVLTAAHVVSGPSVELVPQCSSDDQCMPYQCQLQNFQCETRCISASDCFSPNVCYAFECVPPLQDGTTCTRDEQCLSGTCCEDAMSSGTCQTTCMVITLPPPEDILCTTAAECAGQYCCPVADSYDMWCQSTACVLGQNGSPCVGNDYCSSGYCDGACVEPPLLGVGEACMDDAECASASCCYDDTLEESYCAEECAQLTGDPCLDGDDCDGGYCWTSLDDLFGFCTNFCDPFGDECGFNSDGTQNECIETDFDECRPGCNSDAECQTIHPDLLCYSNSLQSGCDFEDATWPE